MILSNEEIKDTLMPRKDLAQSHLEANTRIRELEEIIHTFLRAPSVGSDGPGSSTIVVQEYHLRAARAALEASKRVEKYMTADL